MDPSVNLQRFSHSDFEISYPDNWQVFGDQNSSVTIAPQSGVSNSAVAYGIMINTFQPEDPNASLDQATHELLASLRQSNPDLREIGHDENIRLNGIAGKSVDLVGSSPLQDQEGGRWRKNETGWWQSNAAMAASCTWSPSRRTRISNHCGRPLSGC